MVKPRRKSKTRMFQEVTSTWNPIVGCLHMCTYCWARRLAVTKLRHLPQYRDGFEKPKLVESAFRRRFRPGELVFVSDMGDMWGEWVPREWILRVLDYTRRFPKTTFLYLTKNPARYHEFLDDIPENSILGATIETNRDDLAGTVSRAPPPSKRYIAMKTLEWPRKMVSIEPILDFDIEVMASWIREIQPIRVYIGYDNYGNNLPEPPLWKTKQLIRKMTEMNIEVSIKTLPGYILG